MTTVSPTRTDPAPRIDTAAFTLSAFDGERDRDRLAAWLINPRVVGGFARAPADPDSAAAARWIAACDGRHALLLAIRERANGKPLGFWHIRADGRHRRAELSVALGERSALGRDAATETGIALFDWIFASTGIEKLTAHVLERNRLARAIAARWMRYEARLVDEIRAPGGGRLTVLRYGLLRGEWLGHRADAAASIATVHSC